MSTCEGCGREFEKNYPEQRFHSQSCFMGWYNRSSADGHGLRGAVKGGATRGKQIKTSASGTGYVKVPGRDTHEHRAVAEQILGRPLRPEEVVHHEDQNKQNNDRTNLIVFVSQAQHARHHGRRHCGLPTCDCQCIRLEEVMPNDIPSSS